MKNILVSELRDSWMFWLWQLNLGHVLEDMIYYSICLCLQNKISLLIKEPLDYLALSANN